MGMIGKVIKSYISKLSGSNRNAQFGSVEEFAGDERTVQYFGPCNEDFAPPENCETYNKNLGEGAGYKISIAYHNQLIAPVAIQGEKRIFSTNQAGDTVMAEVFLKQDGVILIKNSIGEFEMATDGTVTINGAQITPAGDFITKLGISLDLHTHPQGVDSASNTQANTGAPL